MQNITGQIAQGDNFFDRKRELAAYWRALETDNILLLAPRRVGKSSVMKQMEALADGKGFTAVYVEVSDCADELQFVQRLYTEILGHHRAAERLWNSISNSWLGKTIGSIKKAGAAGFSIEFSGNESKWAHMGEDLASALSKLDSQTLIQIDELPVFALKLLNRTDETDQSRIREFLYWMRRLRQTYPQVRWMLAGSIGLDTVASRFNIADSINDLRIETLGAYDAATSHALLQSLAAAYTVDLAEVVREHIIRRVGWTIPYYLQLIFDKLREHKTPTIEHVNAAIDILLDSHHKGLFDYWRQRLCDELGRPDADYASALLHPVSRTPEGVRRSLFGQTLTKALPDPEAREDKIRYLLDVLENDGYLVNADGVWRFRSPLLREYWLRRVAPPEQPHE